MPDRHPHDEFIRALIFSTIINLLIVFALVAQRSANNPAKFQPFFVSIATSHTALPRKSLAKVRAIAVSPPATATKKTEPVPNSLAQNASAEPALLPPAHSEEDVINPVALTETERKGADLPRPAAELESATTAPDDGTADGTALARDKTAGDHYTAPERLGDEKPPYPKWAERNGWEGRVLLTLLINVDGLVERVDVTETSGYELLDRQACQSVGAWQFKPARRNGIAVTETVHLPIIFRRTFSGNVR